MVSLIFLLHFDMYLERLVEKLEIFNEVTTLVLLYHLLGFTNFVSDIETQYIIGFSFVFFLSGNMATHVYFLLRSSCRDCKTKYKQRQRIKKMRKIQNQRESQEESKIKKKNQRFVSKKKRKSTKASEILNELSSIDE